MSKFFHCFAAVAAYIGSFFVTTEETASPCVRTPPACRPAAPALYYLSCSPVGVDLSFGLDDYRGIYSGSWNGSFGALSALNLTYPAGDSFSMQLAGSYGLYDWAGRASTPFKNSKTFQQQGFATVAASWQTACARGWNAGIAYDWMLNKNFGEFAVNPCFDQVRGQLGYLFRGGNELGAWGTYGIRKAHAESQSVPLKFKGISQANLFWVHYFKDRGYGMLWAGTPYQRGLLYSNGRAGNYIFGAQFSIPVTCSLSIEGHGSYMGPRGESGVTPRRIMARTSTLGSPIRLASSVSSRPPT